LTPGKTLSVNERTQNARGRSNRNHAPATTPLQTNKQQRKYTKMARKEPRSSEKEPIVGDSQSTAESKRIGVSIHPDSSYDETTPLNADHNNGQDDGSNWGEELQNQDDSSDDSSDDAQDGEER
jgi:Tfp pilus assembly protein PilE